jgi:hypothetical protein
MVVSAHLSFSMQQLVELHSTADASHAFRDASASQGFVADIQYHTADGNHSLGSSVDLSSVGIESDILKQAHAAWLHVFNRILRVGCRGCKHLKV